MEGRREFCLVWAGSNAQINILRMDHYKAKHVILYTKHNNVMFMQTLQMIQKHFQVLLHYVLCGIGLV
jgi:hypothetical protein